MKPLASGGTDASEPDAERLLQRLLSNDVTKLAADGAQYSVLCRDDGGVLDDLFTYRLAADRFLTVTNASNHDKDLAWLKRAAHDHDATVADRLHDLAMLAVQGPEARGIVQELADQELPRRFRTSRMTVAGAPDVLVCGTGYTGEDGVELLVAPEHATTVWDAVVESGATTSDTALTDSTSA